MVTQELITYIKQSLATGKTRQEIQNALLVEGSWQVADITEAFAVIEDSAIVPKKKSHSGLVVFIGILVIAGGVWYVYGAIIKAKVKSILYSEPIQEVVPTSQIEQKSENQDQQTTDTPNTTVAVSPSNETQITTATSFLEYLKQGKSVSCTGNLSIPGIDFSIMYFISPTKARVDSQMTVHDPNVANSVGTTHRVSSTIDDGMYTYDWSSDSTNGLKKVLTTPFVIDETFVKKIVEHEDPRTTIVCHLWQYDPVKFIPPSLPRP